MKKFLKSKNGITLISLVVTIIILLILTGISISMLSGNNGILRQAGNAKKETDIAEEKELLQTAVLSAISKEKYGDMNKDKLDEELDKMLGSSNYSSELVEDVIAITFIKSGRTYIVDSSGNVEKMLEATGITSLAATKTSISVGETTQLTPILEPIKSFGKVIYSSSDTSIATISDSGLVTGISNGTAEITATINGEEKKIIIIVEKKLTATELNGDLLGIEVDYSGYSASYSGGWRVFYATDEETFIISTDTIDSNIAFSGNNGIPLVSKAEVAYTGSFDVANSEYGKTWNKMWVIDQIHQSTTKVNGINPESLQNQNRHKATAYMCDKNNWTDYVAGSANYAVGGPTLELFIKAWNNRPNNTEITEITGTTDYGYAAASILEGNIIEQNILSLDITKKNGLYNNGKDYKLASPASYENSWSLGWICMVASGVGGKGNIDKNNYNSASDGIRPLVSIPTSKLKENSAGTKLLILP